MKGSFDGRFTNKKSERYLKQCPAKATDLDYFRIGKYDECAGCEYQVGCINDSRFKFRELFFTNFLKLLKRDVFSRA